MMGRDQTIKIILSSYISVLVSDAAGGFCSKIVYNAMLAMGNTVNEDVGDKFLLITKISIFISLIVALTVRGAFAITVPKESNSFMSLVITIIYGILSAGLIVSTVLVYISGISLFLSDGGGESFSIITRNNHVISLIIDNYSIWFSLPAIAFVISSLFSSD